MIGKYDRTTTVDKFANIMREMANQLIQLANHNNVHIDDACEMLDEVIAFSDKRINALLDKCGDGECPVCSSIICPDGDVMHFHHDGCPSCAEREGF